MALQGVPIQIEIDVEHFQKQQLVLVRRDTSEKSILPWMGIQQIVLDTLESIQRDMFNKYVSTVWGLYHCDGMFSTGKQIKAKTKWPQFCGRYKSYSCLQIILLLFVR